uniref:Lipocalin n=1 Tax=Rhinella marina TaxID=8386 RepID=LIPO_RHIMB|nr:RecName: Full=Lipocalin; Flags: Precursor [Rhinella marina]AAA48554.1 lipocalin [Rhinella marina]CAA48138.1 lipocalin [Rhinella marina]
MKGLVLSFALVALSALCVYGDVPIQPDFQEDKILGKWYGIGLASNSNWFQSKKQQLKMCTTVITPTADGNLDVVATFPKLDRCEKKSMTYIKTEQPGRFLSKSPRYGSDHVIRVVESNYDEYTLMHTIKTKGNEVNTIVSLFGRRKTLSPELLDKFQQFAKEQGLTDDNILILPQTDSCMSEV